MSAGNRGQLADFLRSRRAGLTPADVGLPGDSEPGKRRTPGLRREEVAELSGVGVTWYTWLEQGRKITASPQVVDALARALRLSADEHRHLRDLALERDAEGAARVLEEHIGGCVDHVLAVPSDKDAAGRLGLTPGRYAVGLANTQPHKNFFPELSFCSST